MKALVAVRAVVDSERVGGAPTSVRGPVVSDPCVDRAVRLALGLAPASTVAVSIAPPERAEPALRRALSLGASDALLVWHDAFADADVPVTATILAAVARSLSADVLVCGGRSDDVGTGALPGYIAELLGWAYVDGATSAGLAGNEVHLVRRLGGVCEIVAAPLPLVVAAADDTAVAYPSVAARLRAARVPLRTLSLEEVGIDTPGVFEPRSRVERLTLPKPLGAVAMRAVSPSPEARAAIALAGPMGPRAEPLLEAEGVAAAVRTLEEIGVIAKGEPDQP